MNRNYERLAWTVLLISFTLCVILVVGVPLAIQWYVRYSYAGQIVSLDVQDGNLLVTCPGTDVPIGIVNRQEDVCQGRDNIQILAGPTDQGLLTIRPRNTLTSTLAAVQIYRGSRITLQQATTPRFPDLSAEPDRVTIQMNSGRIRVTIPPSLARVMVFQINTPQALVQLSDGSVSVEVSQQETQIIVREGKALVGAQAAKSSVELLPAQRVVVANGSGVSSVFTAERNLLAGYTDFREPTGAIWKVYTLSPQIEGESRGQVDNVTVEGRQAVDFSRVGQGFAETGIKQDINRDIRDFRSLQLRVWLRVLQQDVPLCGTAGTECPVMVRLDYVDENGEARFWQQGFYYLPDPSSVNPEFCNTCNPRNIHVRVVNGQWYPFESPNLIPVLNIVGPAPVVLKSVSIYASGHTYQSQVAEIELTGQE